MRLEIRSVSRILVKTIVLIFVLFLVSTPVFYWIISSSANGRDFTYVYVTARSVRLIAALVMSYVIRKRHQEVLAQAVAQKKKLFNVLFCLICFSVFLRLHHTTSKLYSAISHMIGIYDSDVTPLFLTVLWEQLFAGDLYWSILLGLSIVFFTHQRPAKLK